MGIRFACHVCGKQLNIKRELGGRRGVCPACSARFRIPLEDTETSSPIEARTPLAAQSSQSTEPGQSTATVAASDVAVGHPVSQNAVLDSDAEASEAESSISEDRIASITLLDDDPQASWYVRPPSGGQYGPASSDILKQWIEEGRVAATALLWRDGWPQWRDASDVLPELAEQLPNGSVASRAPSAGSQSRVVASETEAAQLSGQASVGTTRRARSMKRVLLVGVLTAVAATLVGVLVVVVNRTGG